MFKVIEDPKANRRVISMDKMEPGDVGKIIETKQSYSNHLVMRTTNSRNFEIMDLTEVGLSQCWSDWSDMTL